MNKKETFLEKEGQVVKRYNVNSFQVKLDNEILIEAEVANQLKRKDRRWKVITEGDRVVVEIALGDLKGRIISILS